MIMPYESFQEMQKFKKNRNRLNIYSQLIDTALELHLLINTSLKNQRNSGFHSCPVVYTDFCKRYRNYYGSDAALKNDGGLRLFQIL